jgi:hypothetical protein
VFWTLGSGLAPEDEKICVDLIKPLEISAPDQEESQNAPCRTAEAARLGARAELEAISQKFALSSPVPKEVE